VIDPVKRLHQLSFGGRHQLESHMRIERALHTLLTDSVAGTGLLFMSEDKGCFLTSP
jgi:hypothetical protein